MFPHLFQHWLTAKSANSFKLAVVAHPLLIMLVWVPCVLIGAWATSAAIDGKMVVPPTFSNPNAVLAFLVNKLTNLSWEDPHSGYSRGHHVEPDLAVPLHSSIFTNDIVAHYA